MTNRPPLSPPPTASGGLARSLLWLVLPLTLAPLLAAALGFYRQSEAELSRHLNTQLDTLANAKLTQLNQWATQQVIALDGLARDPQLSGLTDAPTEASSATLRDQLDSFLRVHPAFQRILIVDAVEGAIWLDHGVASTRPPSLSESFLQWARYETQFLAPRLRPEFDERAVSLVVTAPMASGEQGATAVLVGVLRQEPLLQIVAPAPGLGSTGQAYLVSADGYRLGVPVDSARAQPRSDTIRRVLEQAESGGGFYANAAGADVIGRYAWLDPYQLALFVEQEWAEAASPLVNTLWILAAVTLGGAVLVTVVSVFFTRRLTRPIRALTDSAARLAAGEMAAQVDVDRNDELGVLAQAFNRMSEDLSISYQTLQTTAETRARQLAITAEMSRVAAAHRSLAQLLPEVTSLIQRRFGYDCVLAFTADETGEVLHLQEATGGPAQDLKAQRLSVTVESQTLLGQVARARSARTAAQVEAPALHHLDARLAEFVAEAALPLAVGDRLSGALVCLSRQPEAFSGADFDILQTLTDQAAVAVENCQLFERQQSVLRLEELVLSLSAKAHQARNAETILESTAVELGRALGARRAVVRLHGNSPASGPAPGVRWE